MRLHKRIASAVLACTMALCVLTACGGSSPSTGTGSGTAGTGSGTGTGTTTGDTTTDTGNTETKTEETIVSGPIELANSKTYALLTQFSAGKYTISCTATSTSGDKTQETTYIEASNGTKSYAKTIRDDKTSQSWRDKTYNYYISKLNGQPIIYRQKITSTPTGTVEELQSEVTKATIEAGKFEVDGIEYYCETFTATNANGTTVMQFCYNKTTGSLTHMIIKAANGTSKTFKNIQLSFDVDEKILDPKNAGLTIYEYNSETRRLELVE